MKILYQESDVSFRSYVSMILSSAFKAEVIEVGNDKEGICLLEFDDLATFDLVIADYNQDSNENSLFDFIKNSSNIPWVFLIKAENRNNENLINLVNETPLTTLIIKPFKDKDFIPVVENLLSGQEQKFIEVIPEVGIEESADLTIPKKKPLVREEIADWSVDKKSSRSNDVEVTDWSIKAKDRTQADENADWELKLSATCGPGAGSENFQRTNEDTHDVTVNKNIELEFDDYISVRLDKFFGMNKVCCDVYLSLSKTKFLKVINADEIYNRDQLHRYENRGKEYLYIKSECAGPFNNWISKHEKK